MMTIACSLTVVCNLSEYHCKSIHIILGIRHGHNFMKNAHTIRFTTCPQNHQDFDINAKIVVQEHKFQIVNHLNPQTLNRDNMNGIYC